MSFFEELKRRNVFRVGTAYIISAWVLLQFADLVLENIQAPDWIMKVFMLALAIGLCLQGHQHQYFAYRRRTGR